MSDDPRAGPARVRGTGFERTGHELASEGRHTSTLSQRTDSCNRWPAGAGRSDPKPPTSDHGPIVCKVTLGPGLHDLANSERAIHSGLGVPPSNDRSLRVDGPRRGDGDLGIVDSEVRRSRRVRTPSRAVTRSIPLAPKGTGPDEIPMPPRTTSPRGAQAR